MVIYPRFLSTYFKISSFKHTFKWEALSKNLIQKKFLRFSVSDWKSRQCYILITLASYLPTNNLITINPVLIIRALLPRGFMWSSLYTGLLIQAILLNMIHPSMMERYRNHINGIYKRKTGWYRLFFRCPMWFLRLMSTLYVSLNRL